MHSVLSRSRSVPVAIAMLLAVIGVVAGLGIGQFNSAFADGKVHVTQSSSNASALAARTYLIDCAHQPVRQPRIYSLTCGDENLVLQKVTWTGWGTAHAHATATVVENTCTPYCAAGNYASAPVKVDAHGLARKAGTAIYTKLTITFTKKPTADLSAAAGVWDVSPASR